MPSDIGNAFVICLEVEPELDDLHTVFKQVSSSEDEESPVNSLSRFSTAGAEETMNVSFSPFCCINFCRLGYFSLP